MTVEDKYQRLKEILGNMENIAIAYSGGVDSTFLLKVAIDVLGKNHVVAVTADSETYPSSELIEAKTYANNIGATHYVVQTSELAIPGYQDNDKNRCYFCKSGLFDELIPLISEKGFENLTLGVIADDMSDYRPGIQAAKDYGVRGPLAEADLYKDEIRQLSKQLDLPTWDKPSFACLSSRIAYGEKITKSKLTKVEKSEAYIKQYGIRQVRVRTHETIARIEVEPQDMAIVLSHHEEITRKLKSFGYTYVTLDLKGYKSGSMNQAIAENVNS
ncbi:ATP-dependent sacrificial sulfur transferase LarE [Tuberibacillus sp. Marseille-P3662]|uniref:ATP-dependent sacrificial sulfur transferase LarE n=1 Tax=Tuberibacillus sp. Marseille-P3662 TaxID=1965358 RepID=UPI0020CAABFB|nr:ATP-dependent sacrificial sulfur transferase LarE [Tuberibacillus sp. Marseille-P3662]